MQVRILGFKHSLLISVLLKNMCSYLTLSAWYRMLLHSERHA